MIGELRRRRTTTEAFAETEFGPENREEEDMLL
jgi:hypothetical protein